MLVFNVRATKSRKQDREPPSTGEKRTTLLFAFWIASGPVLVLSDLDVQCAEEKGCFLLNARDTKCPFLVEDKFLRKKWVSDVNVLGRKDKEKVNSLQIP